MNEQTRKKIKDYRDEVNRFSKLENTLSQLDSTLSLITERTRPDGMIEIKVSDKTVTMLSAPILNDLQNQIDNVEILISNIVDAKYGK